MCVFDRFKLVFDVCYIYCCLFVFVLLVVFRGVVVGYGVVFCCVDICINGCGNCGYGIGWVDYFCFMGVVLCVCLVVFRVWEFVVW